MFRNFYTDLLGLPIVNKSINYGLPQFSTTVVLETCMQTRGFDVLTILYR